MLLLEVTLTNWADRWYLAGISVATVFVILIVLVIVLQVFSMVAKSASKAPKAAVAPTATKAAPLAGASEEEKAAVAVALYLYMNNAHDEESGKLTIAQAPSQWHAVLNPRL